MHPGPVEGGAGGVTAGSGLTGAVGEAVADLVESATAIFAGSGLIFGAGCGATTVSFRVSTVTGGATGRTSGGTGTISGAGGGVLLSGKDAERTSGAVRAVRP